MYDPEHFREQRDEILHAFIDAHPLGALVTLRDGGLTADHIPMLRVPRPDGTQSLRRHVARANPIHRQVADGDPVLVIFGGAQAYISPSWYPSKREDGRVVPTWNYTVVHARGRIRFERDASWLRELVGALTDRHEAGRVEPWKVDDAPPDYIERMLAAIVGFEIEIDTLVGKFKASQNREAADRAGVASGLAAEPDRQPAAPVDALVREPRSRPPSRAATRSPAQARPPATAAGTPRGRPPRA